MRVDSRSWWKGRQGKDQGQLKRVLGAVPVFSGFNQFGTSGVNTCRHVFHDENIVPLVRPALVQSYVNKVS
jgi:hypothetical protein